ncbi:hypothetical protein [Parvicella tangerina]|uniref:Uncharacterized protein n=1 Tax=Parvicella tangerina TaxID=2829795 RepID=A0A916JNS2_9FLAO|nr:hypothetical protein [Parvicella tangerina]CAG5083269.1 hypothetical protein CRYO30217_02144 [Parvicella tangerina]
MRLVDLQIHFLNNSVVHYQRMPGWEHDVYRNEINSRKFTIPIDEDELPDEYCQLACLMLDIEGINGETQHQLAKNLADSIKNNGHN